MFTSTWYALIYLPLVLFLFTLLKLKDLHILHWTAFQHFTLNGTEVCDFILNLEIVAMDYAR